MISQLYTPAVLTHAFEKHGSVRPGSGLDDFMEMKSQFLLLGFEPRLLGCPADKDVSTNKDSDTKNGNPVDNTLIIYNNLPTN